MLTLSISIAIMLAIAFMILRISFATASNTTVTEWLITSTVVAVSSLSLYLLQSDQPALRQWLSTGKEHYQLQVDIDKLGGIDGLIKRVQAKLEHNPNDANGWLILGKLYLGKHDNQSAKAAFKRAKALSQTD